MSTVTQLEGGRVRLPVGEPTHSQRTGTEAAPIKEREDVEPTARKNRPEPTRALLEKSADEMNRSLASVTSLRFSIDQDVNKVVVRVVDKLSKEVIRQIPNEEMIALTKKMKELQGVLLNTTA